MSVYKDQNAVETTEEELRGSQGIIIRNMSLIKAEFNRLIASSQLRHRLSNLQQQKENGQERHPLSNLQQLNEAEQEREFNELKEHCENILTIKKFKRFIYKNVSYFSAIHQSSNSQTLIHETVKEFLEQKEKLKEKVDKDSISEQQQLMMKKLNMLMFILTDEDAYFHSIFQNIVKVTEFSNIHEIFGCDRNIFKLLISSIIFKHTNSDTSSNGQINYTLTDKELVISHSELNPRWDDLQYCLNSMLNLLQEKQSLDVTKITILKSRIQSGDEFADYLNNNQGKQLKIHNNTGNVMIKKSQQSQDISIDVNHSFEFTLIELLREVACVFSDILPIANYCEHKRVDIRKDLAQKKMVMKLSKNIFYKHLFGKENNEGDHDGEKKEIKTDVDKSLIEEITEKDNKDKEEVETDLQENEEDDDSYE